MLLKKALFLITSENEIEPLVNFATEFKKKYKVEIDAMYVKDILKYEIFPATIEGVGINLGSSYAFREYKELEDKKYNAIEEKIKNNLIIRFLGSLFSRLVITKKLLNLDKKIYEFML